MIRLSLLQIDGYSTVAITPSVASSASLSGSADQNSFSGQ